MGKRRIVYGRRGQEKLVYCRVSKRSTTLAEGREDFTEKREGGSEGRRGGRHGSREGEEDGVVGREQGRQGVEEIAVETAETGQLDRRKRVSEDLLGLVPESAVCDLFYSVDQRRRRDIGMGDHGQQGLARRNHSCRVIDQEMEEIGLLHVAYVITAMDSPDPPRRGGNPVVAFIIGLAIILLASILNAAGLNLTKLDHVRSSAIPKQVRKKDYLRPLWLLGMLLYMQVFLLLSSLHSFLPSAASHSS